VGTLAVAGGVYGARAIEQSQGHPEQVASVELSAEQQAQLNDSAGHAGLRILGMEPRDHISALPGNEQPSAVVEGDDFVVHGQTTFHNPGNRGSVYRVDTTIHYDGTPDSQDPAAVAEFLGSAPPLESIETVVETGVTVPHTGVARGTVTVEGSRLTVRLPEDEGYNFDRYPDEMYTADPVTQAHQLADYQ
jgi:hypothetical protein